MAAALGPLVSFPDLQCRSYAVKNSTATSGYDNTYEQWRCKSRRKPEDESSSSLLRLRVCGQTRDIVLGSTLNSYGSSLQIATIDRWVCTSATDGKASAIGASAIEELGELVEERKEEEVEKAEYNWRTEWYPLYLDDEIPRDAPLSLRVYDHDLVLFYDGQGELNCLEDRCPHRAAKLSDGQVIDGTLECLYHGWQFKGDGNCVKIPQLPQGAVIPRKACARSYAIKVSQEVVWVWMDDKSTADESKIPFFENFLLPGFKSIAAIHDFPYDHSILVENVLDPAHVPISHHRKGSLTSRDLAEALKFEVTERSMRGFGANVMYPSPVSKKAPFQYRFQAPSIVRNERYNVDKDGNKTYHSATFLIRPTGQGKSSIITRFGGTGRRSALFSAMPRWIPHMMAARIFEEDMNFLAAQNETMIRKGVPTSDFYLSLLSVDTMVMEYRKWLDRVGKGLPYYFGHKTVSNSPISATQERIPAGFEAYSASTLPSKGAFGHMYARDMTNRYFRHIVHCKSCRTSLSQFRLSQKVSLILATVSTAVAIMLTSTKWKAVLVIFALTLAVYSWASRQFENYMTQNFIRPHRQ